jgi:hypothetical protein
MRRLARPDAVGAYACAATDRPCPYHYLPCSQLHDGVRHPHHPGPHDSSSHSRRALRHAGDAGEQQSGVGVRVPGPASSGRGSRARSAMSWAASSGWGNAGRGRCSATSGRPLHAALACRGTLPRQQWAAGRRSRQQGWSAHGLGPASCTLSAPALAAPAQHPPTPIQVANTYQADLDTVKSYFVVSGDPGGIEVAAWRALRGGGGGSVAGAERGRRWQCGGRGEEREVAGGWAPIRGQQLKRGRRGGGRPRRRGASGARPGPRTWQ